MQISVMLVQILILMWIVIVRYVEEIRLYLVAHVYVQEILHLMMEVKFVNLAIMNVVLVQEHLIAARHVQIVID